MPRPSAQRPRRAATRLCRAKLIDESDETSESEDSDYLEAPSKKPRLATEKMNEKDDQGSSVPCFNPTDNIFISSCMATILVGSEKVRFLIHENVFAQPYAGCFLSKPLAASCIETSPHALELPDDDPKAFGIFVKWLYDISLNQSSAMSIAPTFPDARSRVNIYIFAQKYACQHLHDIIISDMYKWVSQGQKAEKYLGPDVLQLVVTTVQHSRMLTLLAKWFARDALLGEIEDAEATFDLMPNDLLRMVMREMCGSARGEQVETMLGHPCDYHLHQESGVCPSDEEEARSHTGR